MEALKGCRYCRGVVEVTQTSKGLTSVPTTFVIRYMQHIIDASKLAPPLLCLTSAPSLRVPLIPLQWKYLLLLTNFTPTQPYSTSPFSKAPCSDLSSSTYTGSLFTSMVMIPRCPGQLSG